jgi:hypothetical protein
MEIDRERERERERERDREREREKEKKHRCFCSQKVSRVKLTQGNSPNPRKVSGKKSQNASARGIVHSTHPILPLWK